MKKGFTLVSVKPTQVKAWKETQMLTRRGWDASMEKRRDGMGFDVFISGDMPKFTFGKKRKK